MLMIFIHKGVHDIFMNYLFFLEGTCACNTVPYSLKKTACIETSYCCKLRGSAYLCD